MPTYLVLAYTDGAATPTGIMAKGDDAAAAYQEAAAVLAPGERLGEEIKALHKRSTEVWEKHFADGTQAYRFSLDGSPTNPSDPAP